MNDKVNENRRFKYAHMKAHIGEYPCACGRPGVRLIGRQAVCAVCDTRNRRRGLLVLPGKKSLKWQQPERLSYAEQMWASRLEETRLRVAVEEAAGELVVRAHGEYHLSLKS